MSEATSTKLRHSRVAWIAHCRAVYAAQEAVRRDNDGMSHGIIPSGAVHYWADVERDRLAQALSAPVPARIMGWDESGVGLVLTCPYCRKRHAYIVASKDWTPEEPLQAPCGRGTYRVQITPVQRKSS